MYKLRIKAYYAHILKTTPLNITLKGIYKKYTGNICQIVGIEGRDFTDIYII